MPRYDYMCTACERIRNDVWVSSFRDALGESYQPDIAPCECGNTFWKRQPSAPNFVINGYNAKNGYSK